MKNRIIVVLMILSMLLSLFIVSCETKEAKNVEVEEDKDTVTITEELVGEQKVQEELAIQGDFRDPKEPKYGGVFTIPGGDPVGFDTCYNLQFMMAENMLITEGLVIADWSKGPAGTGDTDWTLGHQARTKLLTGGLAESWEFPDNETIIWHIRPGVQFWDKEPVNGREFTAYDAEYVLNRDYFNCPKSSWASVRPSDKIISITALDKYTLEWKVPEHIQGSVIFDAWSMRMYAPEVIDQCGDMRDWKTMVATGPFMITDYVVGSSMELTRNPNYWQVDPVHTENQLPYLEKIKEINIPDTSSIQAAFRTGKIDILYDQKYEDFELLKRQCPEINYNQQFLSATFLKILAGRTDKPELPFQDVRVRRAMNIAINQQELVEDYYDGQAALLGYPYLPIESHADIYTPLEEMPESVQELFDYNPEKAKQLLVEAGYPNGFKTSIVAASDEADFLSIIREYLLNVGIDMQINVGEGSMIVAQIKGRDFPEMCSAMHYPFSVYKMATVLSYDPSNPSFWTSDEVLSAFHTVQLNIGKNDEAVAKALREIAPHILDNAPYVFLPAPYGFTLWWPWVQNYHGETLIGGSSIAHLERIFIWMDEDVKRAMGY